MEKRAKYFIVGKVEYTIYEIYAFTISFQINNTMGYNNGRELNVECVFVVVGFISCKLE